MDVKTVRVLSFDGGGMRGYLSLKFFQLFLQQWGIAPNEIWKYFDVIAGTSIGGIQALGYAYGATPEEMEGFFTEKGKWIFTIRSITDLGFCDASNPSNRPNLAQKLGLVALDEPLYQSACPATGYPQDSNYGNVILNQLLASYFGTSTMQDLKTKVVIPSYRYDSQSYVNISNDSSTNMFVGQNNLITDTALATSAAPVYLPSRTFGETPHEYIDGGVYQNNPAGIALSLGRALKPKSNRFCVLSLGTGLGEMGFDTSDTNKAQLSAADSAVVRTFKLFNMSSTGGQESVDFDLKLRAKNPFEQLHYYRFQPKLDQTMDTELDNSDPAFLQYLAATATDHYRNDSININNFLGHLIA